MELISGIGLTQPLNLQSLPAGLAAVVLSGGPDVIPCNLRRREEKIARVVYVRLYNASRRHTILDALLQSAVNVRAVGYQRLDFRQIVHHPAEKRS